VAKDNRKILNSVRFSRDKVFHPGMEDELAAAASPEQLARLTEKGVITGDFKGGKKSTAEVESADGSDKGSGEVEAEKAPSPKGKK
jgi:hypothetical protein